MNTPLDPSKPFYFTQTPPTAPKVKRGTWTLPILATVIAAIVLMFGLGQLSSSVSSPAVESTPSPSPSPTPTPSPQAATQTAPQAVPTPTPSATPAVDQQGAFARPDTSSSYSPYTSQQQSRTETGLPWNANVKLSGNFKVLEVHSLPSVGSEIIGILEQGDAVRVLTPPTSAEGVFWVNVQKGGYSGWVRSDFLEVRQ